MENLTDREGLMRLEAEQWKVRMVKDTHDDKGLKMRNACVCVCMNWMCVYAFVSSGMSLKVLVCWIGY